MVTTRNVAVILVTSWIAVFALAQTSTTPPPATAPTTQSTYDRLLGSEPSLAEKPLQPTARKTLDASTGTGAMAPGAPQLPTKREGTFIVDRTGRLARSGDAQGWEFTFDADGQTLQDPPMKVLPNLKLMVMEEAIESGGADLRFRVSGTLTEYRGRNYILLEKVIVVQDK